MRGSLKVKRLKKPSDLIPRFSSYFEGRQYFLNDLSLKIVLNLLCFLGDKNGSDMTRDMTEEYKVQIQPK